MTKHSEATYFRDWCESERARLMGSKDTSFLEYCLKQSRSEAEMLLVKKLESLDLGHKFMDKFLNYKDLLLADVIDIAFQSRNYRNAAALGASEMSSDDTGLGRSHQDSLVAADELSRGREEERQEGEG